MKKFLAFACCFAPFGALAADPIVIDPATTPNANVMDGFTVPSDNYAIIKSGQGLALGSGGMSAGSLYVGKSSTNPDTPTGEVFVEPTAAASYNILSDGNVSITSILNVLDGHTLQIGVKTQNQTISNVSLGAVTATGALTVRDAETLETQNITSNTALSMSATDIESTGTVTIASGTASINASNDLTVTNAFITKGNSTTEIDVGGDMSVTSFQNQSGSVTITSSGDITSSANFENFGAGTTMTITGTNTDMVVDGTMQNAGTMTLQLKSLTVNGGSSSAASFVNTGNLGITVSGETNLAYGFDLSNMGTANTFSLTTGTLVVGGGADGLSSVFENNKLANFNLAITNGTISANNITNGSENPLANMTLDVGGNITAQTIQNRGSNLNVSTVEDSAGNITLTSSDVNGTSIYGAANSTTTVIADGTLNVTNGAVTNNGTMTLNGNVINLSSVANTGNITIAAQTDPTGSIGVSGNITNNSGTTSISARQIAINGTVHNVAGTTTISGSDTLSGSVAIGGIDAAGGTMNVNALIGSISVTGSDGLSVTNGVLNIGANTYQMLVNDSIQIDGNINLVATPTTNAGDVNILNSGVNRFVLSSVDAKSIDVGGNIIATASDVARTASLVADAIEIDGNVTVANKGDVAFINSSAPGTLSIGGDVTANNGGVIEIYSGATTLKSLSGNGLFKMHGASVSTTTGNINVSNGIWYDGTTGLTSGMVISGTDEFTLQTTASEQDVTVTGGISVSDGVLNIVSANDATISGAVVVDTSDGELNVTANDGDITFNGAITASDGGEIALNGSTVTTAAINVDSSSATSLTGTANTNSVTTGIVSNAGDLDIAGKQITMAGIQSTGGTSDITATNTLQINTVDVSGGTVTLTGATINSATMNLSGGTTKLASGNITTTGDITVSNGDLSQGGNVGVMILTNDGTLSASNLTVEDGKLLVQNNDVIYNINNTATFANGIEVTTGSATINATDVAIDNGYSVVNLSGLTINATHDLALGTIQNTGNLVLTTTGGTLGATSLTNNTGTTKITSNTTTMTGTLTAGGVLYQNYTDALGTGDVNITSANHTLTASNLITHGINQATDASIMTIKTSDVNVTGNISAKDLRIEANPAANWLNVNVTGNVSGGVDFVGLEHMNIGGNYRYDNNSMLHAAILTTPGVTINSTTYNYWSTVSLADDNTFGTITNATDGNAAPLITVGGNFIYDVSNIGDELSGTALVNPQIGIDIFDMVDSGTAIWLLQANGDEGLTELSDKIRNLNVNFCNSDGTKCFKYFDNTIAENAGANQTETGLPAYLTIRDVNDDGISDSIYIVFDSRFGGPVEVFKIQPIVDRVPDHTDGEYDAAGALDDMIEGGLQDAHFYNHTPIEAIPVAFGGTNLEELATELYNRMEQYQLNRDGTPLARFSRLVQPREIEQIVGSVVLNEHTTFRDFEDHVLDEFIWNRHRALKKAWVDVDYGLFYQNTSDGKRANGDRFSIVGGYDWQHTSTLILGVTGRVSHMSADNNDAMDLSYKTGETVDGHINFDVADTDIGLGAYMMKTLGTKARLYGNAFFDLHLLDISRNQNFVSHINGSGQAFSLISEWGLLHDWLNQYIVGNLYARVGYNFGFSVKEESAGAEYMRLDSDGYMIFTPGYSLIAQKRFYPSSWFQIRPYASAGVEYDVLGAPEFANFKFGPAKRYTKYDIEINPLWANIGGGVELLSATGFQVGLDYRYQYNQDIQLHKVRLSGSYRF